MEKNQHFSGIVTGMTSEGMGVSHAEGMAVFLPAVCVGDEIEFSIVKVQRHFAYGRLVKMITPSADRVEALCPAFPRCGGCSYRCLKYEAELQIKARNVAENFKKLGGLDLPVTQILSNREERYRNKAIYPVGEENGRLVAGFYAPRSHRVIGVADCILQPADFAPLVETILRFGTQKGWHPYDRETKKGQIRHIFLRKGFASGQKLITLIVPSLALNGAEELAEKLMAQDSEVVGVLLCENKRDDNVLMGDRFRLLAGRAELEDNLCGLTFAISPPSFYQVNPVMAEKLYETAGRLLNPQPGEILLDLYCGAGTIGLSLAKRFEKVIGVEIIPAAIENAKENAKRNNITNAEFFCADAGSAAAKLAEQGLHPDCIVLDPPRKGCDVPCLDAVVQMNPKRIAMISCNSATAARDVAYLAERGYEPSHLTVADLFPRTTHVETVVLMSRADR